MCNAGFFDRFLRVFVGALIVMWGAFDSNIWGAVGLVPLLTGLIGWCPAYTIFGINSSCKRT